MPSPVPYSLRNIGHGRFVCIDQAIRESRLLAGLAWILMVLTCLLVGCDSKPTAKPSASKPQPIETPKTQSTTDEDFKESLGKASKLLAEKNIQEAWEAVKKLSLVRPQDPQLLYLSALILAAKDDLPGAIQTIRRIPSDANEALPAAGQAAEWTVALGKLPEAETQLLKLVKQYPTAVPAIRLLAKIYNAQGRRFEANRYLDRLIRLGDFTKIELLATVDPRDYFDDENTRMPFAQANPDHPYVEFATIRKKLMRNGYASHLESLKQISTQNPNLIEPWVWTATSLLQTDRLNELQNWLANPPSGADKHPEYWYATGGLMLRTNQYESAARCFVQAIQLDRRHVAAYQGLADSLIEMKLVDTAQKVRRFGNDLVAINDYAQQISYEYGEPKLFDKIAQTYRSLGDEVGAFGWEALAATLGHRPMTDALKDKQIALRKGPPAAPAVLEGLPWESWSLPAELAAEATSTKIADRQMDSEGSPSTGGIAMEDVAKELGITSAYGNGAKPNRSWYTIEGVGGGVNALDYDKDGWPDLVLFPSRWLAFGRRPKIHSQDAVSLHRW